MRDHALKIEAGRIEDEIARFASTIGIIAAKAGEEGATEHAEFYGAVAFALRNAESSVKEAYTLLLNGNGGNIEPLDDE